MASNFHQNNTSSANINNKMNPFYNSRTQDHLPSYIPYFDIKNEWVNRINFVMHKSFITTHQAKNKEYFITYKEEIKLQKILLSHLPLSEIQREALAHATIILVPENFSSDCENSSFYSDYKIYFPLIDFLTLEERKQILVHEIHHLTVYYVNRIKVNSQAHYYSKQHLMYPFLNELGEIEYYFKNKLITALNEVIGHVAKLKTLLQKSCYSYEKCQLQKYFTALKNYQPYKTRYQLSQKEFLNKIANQEINICRNQKTLQIKLPNGLMAYGRIHDVFQGKITILYTFEQNHSIQECAQAFIKDFETKMSQIKMIYPAIHALHGKIFDENDLLREQAGELAQLLTPEMQKIFASKYRDYFNEYYIK